MRFLAERLSLASAEQVLAIVTDAHPTARLLPRTRFMVEKMFGPAGPAAFDEEPMDD